jgi:K+-transporting ATPase ATPase A chain
MLEIVLFLLVLLALAVPLGVYLARVFSGQTSWLYWLEKNIYKFCFIDANEDMHWRQYARALLLFSVLGFFVLFLMQMTQSYLGQNPQGLKNVPWPLALNTAVSFITNTNWQAYSGEVTLSYFVQALGLTVQNFVSAAMGLSVLLALVRGLMRTRTQSIGNFWQDMVRSLLYVLLPLSFLLALALASTGVVQNFAAYVPAFTMEGFGQTIPMGPAASQVAIKQLGTNGGGFFGVNSAHPLENPNGLSNFLQMLAILLLPAALIVMFGIMAKARRHAAIIFVVSLGFLLLAGWGSFWSENLRNPSLHTSVAYEGKEVRFGVVNSIIWSTATTAASNGSVNSMHESLSPLASGLALTLILLGEIIFGGVGSGLYGMLLFVLLTVFLAGLMVGRTPEYLGKKITSFEMSMVLLAIILPGIVTLLGAWASTVFTPLSDITNGGPHGFTSMLYAWGSAANNNGSAFGGLSTNTNFYNLLLALAMLVGRFGVMVPVLAIAGSLAGKNCIPPSLGTFSVDRPMFAILLCSIIVVVGALTFMPALALGPIMEHFLMIAGRTF